MKAFKTRTITIGPCIITIYPREITFLLVRDNKIILKHIPLTLLPGIKRYAGISVTVLMIISGIVLTLSMAKWGEASDADLIADEKTKNSLLLSGKTDFKKPHENVPLAIRFHTVESGETLSKIAQQYGVSIDTICGSNGLESYDLIHTGTILRIPNKDGILQKITPGVGIKELAKKYNVSLEKIVAENGIESAGAVENNSILFIPDAKPQNIIPGFLWPTASRIIHSGYGWRPNPFSGGMNEFHQGLDIRANYEWIQSTRYGQVTFAGWLGGYGNAVIVAHPGGYKSLYAHLSSIIVQSGQYVKQGQIIAKSGSTGRSTGPHLHFEIIKFGVHVNPYYYIIGH